MSDITDLRIASGYWYICSPYSKYPTGLEDACVAVARFAGKLILAGIPIFSPIAMFHPIALAADIDPLDHKIWLPADKPLFDRAHGVLVAALPGWRESHGIGVELEWAREQGKPRFLIDPESLSCTAIP